MFPGRTDKDVAAAINQVITIAANAQPARLMAQSMERTKSKAYLYRFTRLPDTAMARKLGVHHGVELAYVFGNMMEVDGYNAVDMRLANIVMGYWINFARTGNPNGSGLPVWSAYSSKSVLNLEFGNVVGTNGRLYKKEADFISRISSARRDKLRKGNS